MPANHILKIKEVKSLTKLSKASVYRLAKLGEFPSPIKLGERSSGWVSSEIEAWIESRINQRAA